MEPCAPGTEDDPPIMYSTLNKQANEQERILKQKAILKNGKYDNIFELSYVNGAEHWFCHVCECPVMGRVYQHELGKRHTTNFQATNRHVEKRQREKTPEETLTLDIAPGEPIPPGFEGEVDKVAQIQERLDGFKVGPLIALEYLLELQDYDVSKEPVYLCILCDKRGDPRTVLTHLASYNHISQYLQKHFPTCYRALAPYMTKQYKRNWQTTLQKIAEAIEKKFGRLKPLPIEKDKFEKDRLFYLQLVSKGRHFSEMSGWTFEEIIVHDELTKTYEDEKSHESSANNNWGGSAYIQKPFKKRSPSPPVVACPSKKNKGNAQTNPKKQATAFTMGSQSSTNPAVSSQNQNRRRSLSSVSSISSSDLSDNEEKKKAAVKDTKSKGPTFQRGRQLPYERNRSPSPRRRQSAKKVERGLPWQNQGYQKQKNEFEEKKLTEKEREKIRKIEEYRKLGRAIENDMHKTLKQHEKNPEKHPQYNEEWKKFWNKRYKELQAQRIDASKYDFKPEWIEFWNKKMLELHNTELSNRKEGLRKRLGLPDEPTAIKFKIGVQQGGKSSPPEKNKPNLPMAAQPDQDNEVIVIDDKDDDDKSQNRSHSPWEAETTNTKGRVDKSRTTNHPQKRSPPSKEWSREKSPHHKVDRSKKPVTKEMFPSNKRSHSRDRSRSIDRSKEFKDTRSRDRRSRSRDRRSRSRDRRSRSRSWERRDRGEKRSDYHRESSYERDLRAKDRIRTVADLPWEREKMAYRQYEDYYKPPPIMRDVSRKPMIMSDGQMIPDDDDDTEVNIVDVLRILTALEERLGSLGPKVIDLLAQALALEKKDANSSEKLLDSDINCVLFETVKEKLKGQLLAGLVDLMQERAFKKAIKKTATLLHMASERKRQRERMMPKVKEVTVPGVGTVDRVAIAKQIANALILQGKTDVTQSELEQLINAVVGMAEASKNSDKPVTTANFLQKLASGGISLEETKQEIEEKEPEEKIIIPTSFKKTEVVELEKLTEPLTPSPGKNSANNMENLSDSDLQTLLQNFKDLSTDEQHNLINYLKKLETHEPERVERLRKFVSLDTSVKLKEELTENNKPEHRSESPFSSRLAGGNPMVEDMGKIDSEDDEGGDKEEKKTEEKEKPAGKMHLDSEDEDYTFEDVVKAVKDKELEKNMKIVEESMKFESGKTKSDVDLSDAKALISNLMSNFSKSSSASNSIDLLGLGGSSINTPISSSSLFTSTANFAKTLSDINVASLASIVSSVKNLSPLKTVDKPLNFQPPSPLRSNAGKLNFNPSQLNRLGPEPQGNMPGRPSSGPGGPGGQRMGLGGIGPSGPLRGPPNMGQGVPGMGLHGAPNLGRPDMGPGPRGSTGLRPLMGQGNRGFNGPDSMSRDDRGSFGGNFEPDRFSESNFGPRDRSVVQYPRGGNSSYGSNYGNNYPPQQNVQYPSARGGPRQGGFEQRDRFDRFGPGPNNRAGGGGGGNGGGGGYNRW